MPELSYLTCPFCPAQAYPTNSFATGTYLRRYKCGGNTEHIFFVLDVVKVARDINAGSAGVST